MKAQVRTFFRYRYLLCNLIGRDLKVKYRRSVLGYVWSILNPLLMMLVITTFISHLLKVGVPNFPIYYLTGSVIFNFFSEATSSAMTSVYSSAALIKKVYIPKYLFPLEKVLFSFVNMLFSLIACVIMFVVLQAPIYWTVLLFPIPMIYILIFSTGCGLILSSLSVFFRDIVHLYGVFTTALMYMTPIIYSVDGLGQGGLASIATKFISLNPLTHYVGMFRDYVMYGVLSSPTEHLICLAWALGALVLGLIVFKRKQDKFILYI